MGYWIQGKRDSARRHRKPNDRNQSLSVFQERQRDGQLWVEEPLADADEILRCPERIADR